MQRTLRGGGSTVWLLRLQLEFSAFSAPLSLSLSLRLLTSHSFRLHNDASPLSGLNPIKDNILQLVLLTVTFIVTHTFPRTFVHKRPLATTSTTLYSENRA